MDKYCPTPRERWKRQGSFWALIYEPDEVNFGHAGLKMNDLRQMPSGKVRHSIYEPRSHNHSSTNIIMRVVLAFTMLIAPAVWANPLSVSPAYMTSEQLTVTMSPTKAALEGTFTFRCLAGDLAELRVPIWLPSDLRKHPHVPVLMIGGREPKLWREPLWRVPGITEGFGGFAPAQPGFREWVCYIRLRYPLVKGEVPVSIRYTQPLRAMATNAVFCYVPIIHSNTGSGSAIDTNRFSIRIAALPGCSLTVTNGAEEYVVQSEGSINLRPEHLRPIWVGARRVSNPQGGVNGRQPVGPEATRTSAAAASRRSP